MKDLTNLDIFEEELRERIEVYNDLAKDEWNCRCFARMNRLGAPMGEYEAMAAALTRMLDRGKVLGLFK